VNVKTCGTYSYHLDLIHSIHCRCFSFSLCPFAVQKSTDMFCRQTYRNTAFTYGSKITSLIPFHYITSADNTTSLNPEMLSQRLVQETFSSSRITRLQSEGVPLSAARRSSQAILGKTPDQHAQQLSLNTTRVFCAILNKCVEKQCS
jgi:hypothetical protein